MFIYSIRLFSINAIKLSPVWGKRYQGGFSLSSRQGIFFIFILLQKKVNNAIIEK